MFRSGLRAAIEGDPSFSVVAEASDGEEALHVIQRESPDVVVLDINMPKLSGFAVLTELKKRSIDVISIMLTMHDEEAMFAKAMELGVRGYVLKDSAGVDIVNCIHAVCRGQNYTSAAITSYLFKRASSKTAPTGLESLTPAERNILKMIAEYKTSREIAEELSVSIKTVENHRTNISSKLGVNGSHGLIKFALRNLSDIL